MNKLTIDMETRSRVDLIKCGMFKYAESPSTEIICIAVKLNEEEPALWLPEYWREKLPDTHDFTLISDAELTVLIEECDVIEAHNAGFEAQMWYHKMHIERNFPDIPLDKLHCSAAKAATYNIPRKLEFACKALGLSVQKDMVGYKIMLKMCKPRNPTKNNPSEWHENPAEFEILCRYCIGDVEAEHALSGYLRDLPPFERKVWLMDQRINRRGVYIDVKGCAQLKDKVAKKETKLLTEIREITDNEVQSPRQVSALCEWIESKGVKCKDLKAGTVKRLLNRKVLDPNVRRALEIRQALSKSSTKKLDSMLRFACLDNRMRGTIVYHGAEQTGRFAGKGPQPHNFPRSTVDEKVIDFAVDQPVEMIEALYDCMYQVTSGSLRGMLAAGPGKELICADFSAIEARVLAWLAEEKRVLDAYWNGADIYVMNAMGFYNCKQDSVTKDQRQVGKVVELSCGYQGWVKAFAAMAEGYGVHIDEEDAKKFILKWRASRPKTVAMWSGLEDAAFKTIQTGRPHAYGRIKFGIRDRFLHCRLPSGRLLAYCDPAIVEIEVHGKFKDVVSFMGMNSQTKKWERQFTYGGKLTENVVQAVSRDLLVYSMLKLEAAGYPIVLTVHDEIVCELDEGKGSLNEMVGLMLQLPEWAVGLPIDADGWTGKRYKK